MFSPAEVVMATTTNSVEKELLELEKRYWQAIKDKDVDTALQLSDDPCVLTGAQGVGSLDKKTMAAMMKDPSYTLNSFALSEEQVRMLTEDVAVVAYKVHEELTVEGKPVSFDAAEASTWVRRDGRWLCALHTEAIVGDHYGRDRKA
jgi:uncharacterized protein (TIGR02246 family)